MIRRRPSKKSRTPDTGKQNAGSEVSTEPVGIPAHMVHASLEEIRDSHAARLTVAVCSAIVVFTLFWAAHVEVEEKVTGAGTIEPTGRMERIEHPDGGVVRDLMAQDNAVLPAGGIILQLDTDQVEREARTLASRISTLENEALRVRFLIQADGSAMRVESNSGDAASVAFWSEQMFLIAQLERIAAENTTLVSQVQNARALSGIIMDEQSIVEEQLARYARFTESGTVRLIDRERLEREALQLNRTLEEIIGRRTELETAQQENLRQRDELLAKRRRDAAVRLTKIEDELTTLRQALADAAARIERASVRTANGGQVHRLDVRHANEVVAPGDVIAEIVPPGTSFRAVVNISAGRIGSVEEGMDVKLKIESYDFTRFGFINAQVSEVSPTSFVNETGEVVYRVTVNLPEDISGGGEDMSIRPGMTVTADILTDVRTILSYLLHPVRRIQDQSLSEV
ncbi:HlyD family efflux transporter periplasmic adaptor subunit [uncultured Roseobacter sp.]|uniref:HlyD family efflux transporter periplasmic adaptor subunit n=1 Tax=uncultured Roseobacter sp. TaxID=114847 RepID=UPI00260CF26E|nr:HlyD family efflux transporter periplasmic adaptor subunit [uncultured Roseobacter sp.]